MKKEIRIFFTAVMFLTRLPVPRTTDHSDEYLRQAPRYFPVIGWIVGGLCSLAFWLFRRYLSADIGIIASMITGLLVTGCLHEDGFADVCDGMGGGWTKEKILLIMKDSRIGAYGAIGLISILATKFLLLKELRYVIPAILIAHPISRLMPVLVMKLGVYATDPDKSKTRPLAGPAISATSVTIAAITAIVPFFLLPPYFPVVNVPAPAVILPAPAVILPALAVNVPALAVILTALVVILPALAVTYAMYRWFFKWIGGYTGDCLGAIQQVTEISVYLGCIILWRYL